MKNLGILLFQDFEILDVCGPLEMYANASGKFNIILISENSGAVKSAQGIVVETNVDFNSPIHLDLLLIPGGQGTRIEVNNKNLLNWIKEQARKITLLLSVCTGSALLARAGLLDHRKATTNKMSFNWVKQQGQKVNWIEKARWVDDGNIITSSGIAAGIDMSLYVIAKLYGIEEANRVSNITEYVWNRDPDEDFFYKNIK